MSAQHPPLTCDEFKSVLRQLGFEPRPMKSGTSHEDWIPADKTAKFRKVTVDCPKAPFSPDLIGSMAKQAGVSRSTIYDYHFGRLPKPESAPQPVQQSAWSKLWTPKPRKRHHKG
jgi:hypothetical protein